MLSGDANETSGYNGGYGRRYGYGPSPYGYGYGYGGMGMGAPLLGGLAGGMLLGGVLGMSLRRAMVNDILLISTGGF